MPLLKKINPNWEPSENRGLQVGEVLDYPGDVSRLVREGNAIIVDEAGNELPLPGTVFTCAICFTPCDSLGAYTTHVLSHGAKPVAKVEAPTAEIKAEVDEIKAKRQANMAKAQAAMKAKREAAKAAQE